MGIFFDFGVLKSKILIVKVKYLRGFVLLRIHLLANIRAFSFTAYIRSVIILIPNFNAPYCNILLNLTTTSLSPHEADVPKVLIQKQRCIHYWCLHETCWEHQNRHLLELMIESKSEKKIEGFPAKNTKWMI